MYTHALLGSRKSAKNQFDLLGYQRRSSWAVGHKSPIRWSTPLAFPASSLCTVSDRKLEAGEVGEVGEAGEVGEGGEVGEVGEV